MALTYQPFETITDKLQLEPRHGRGVNVGQLDRWISGIGGGVAVAFGIALTQKRGQFWSGLGVALLGGSLVYRGVSGRCEMYRALGIDTRAQAHRGIKVERRITINRSPEELFRFWRDFANLPKFMEHVESVQDLGNGRSRWVARSIAGTSVEWDAEIINEEPNQMIAWRSLEGSQVQNAGSVWFEAAGHGIDGTDVKVSLEYYPPGGKLGAAVAKLFGEDPERQIEQDLARFQQVVESGEIAPA